MSLVKNEQKREKDPTFSSISKFHSILCNLHIFPTFVVDHSDSWGLEGLMLLHHISCLDQLKKSHCILLWSIKE